MFQGFKKASSYGGARKLRLTQPLVRRDNKTECLNKGKNFWDIFHSTPGDPSRKSDVEYCRCNIDYCNEGNAESNSNAISSEINKFVLFMISIFFKSVIQN